MKLECVYLGHDNTINLILKADGVAQDLTSMNKMTLTFGIKRVESTNLDTDPIRWKKEGYQTGEIRLFLGGINIAPAKYNAPLIVYDSGNDDGIVWDYLQIHVIADVEGTTT